MQFWMWGIPEKGGKNTEQTLRFDDDDVNTGKFSLFPTKSLSFGNSGNVFAVKLQSWVDDTASEVSLSPETIYVPRIDLLHYKQIGLPIQPRTPIVLSL